MAQDLVRIKALENQLASGEIPIPDLPMVHISAVFALVQFNQKKYFFPETSLTNLLYHVIMADADEFMSFVGDKLYLPTARFDLSNDNGL